MILKIENDSLIPAETLKEGFDILCIGLGRNISIEASPVVSNTISENKSMPSEIDNASDSIKTLNKNAVNGDVDDQNVLGYCYYDGEGVPQDYNKAIMWYQKSANQGHATAQNNLGYCYAEGNGVPQNHNKAIQLYKQSIANGSESAKHNLNCLTGGNY